MSYDNVIKLALERGFYVQSCEIYSDAPAGFWNYGPLGTLFKNRFIELWRREIVRRDNMIEIDGSQIMSKNVFIASSHLINFVDPIVSCSKCGLTQRADRLISDKTKEIVPEKLSNKEYDKLLQENNIRCPKCYGKLENVRKFNMMFRVGIGARGDDAFLRPETCQSIFVDFPRLFKIMRGKMPFVVAQLGKSFRNEISPRQSLMRLREFYQAEIEVFYNPIKVDRFEMYEEIKDYRIRLLQNGLIEEIPCIQAIEEGLVSNKLVGYYLSLIQHFYELAGIDMRRLRFRRLNDKEKAFYAKSAFDLEVKTSLGWVELVACNDRGDYDLKRHSQVSKIDMEIMDEKEKVLPSIFELSMGIDRSLYCIMEHSYFREDNRNLLKLRRELAPIQVGVFPLINKNGLQIKAQEVYNTLKKDLQTFYDESGSIGRRYRRLDEIGVPLGVTIDYDTLKDNMVTVRDRDNMNQTRVKISELLVKIKLFYLGENIFNQ